MSSTLSGVPIVTPTLSISLSPRFLVATPISSTNSSSSNSPYEGLSPYANRPPGDLSSSYHRSSLSHLNSSYPNPLDLFADPNNEIQFIVELPPLDPVFT